MSDDRMTAVAAFLADTGWAGAPPVPLAGDASNRRYFRLTDPVTGTPAVLMDAPPDKGEDTRPFTEIARHLQALGLSAPEILAADSTKGFLLLEDLGDALFARVLNDHPDREQRLYEAATDVLTALHDAPLPKGIAAYSPDLMTELALLPWRWYAPDAGDSAETTRAALLPLIAETARGPQALALRDYHAENLIWLPGRSAAARVGLLDFQDAMSCHPAYDLVSLLTDARRDVSEDLREAMITRYLATAPGDAEAFRTAFATLSVQRNLRILGVFARLSLHFGKPNYVDLIPRVWGHLMRDLAHPSLSAIADIVHSTLPPPEAAHLKDLKDRCGTHPTP